MMEMIEIWFEQYGYLVLLIGLPLDFIALPIPPGNTTLTYTGYLSFKNVLDVVPAFFMALAGAIGGITITYFIGYKLGAPPTRTLWRIVAFKALFYTEGPSLL